MPRIVPLSELIHPFLSVTVAKPEPRLCTRCKDLAFTPPHPVWDEAAGLCLFHSERADKAEEFKKAIDAMVKAGNCKFRGFVFPPGFSFPAVPLKDADFFRATFQGNASFTETIFRGNTSFRDTFPGPADFWGATFQGNTSFTEAIFRGDASFRAIFWGDASFTEAIFRGNTSFRATFQGSADFFRATFQGNADFTETTFQGSADFFRATFQGDAHFSGGNFRGDARFWSATFQGNANFAGASFRGKTNFSEARFKGAASFRGGVLEVKGQKEQLYELFLGEETLFRRVSFERPELVYFYRVNLSHCCFLDTDLKSLNFIGITQWHRKESKNGRWHRKEWRNGLYDEDHDHSRDRYPELIELYRQLKQNYEERRNWELANHFHYGQMEMHLKEKKLPLREKILLRIYWALSGYGTRFDCTLVWLISVIILFGGVYSYWQLGGSMLLGLKRSLEITTLLTRPPIENFGAPFWLTAVNSLTGASLIALLVLALRRRFRF